jgi:poly[(R)-3-hydroxyalkanoate] polymerase subunit PhaC
MAKTSPSKQRAAEKSEPKKAAAASSSKGGVKGWPAGETLRPLLAAKAPPAKPRRRSEPATAKAANAAPGPPAPPRPAKDKAQAPRRAQRRSPSEIQTGPVPAEPPASKHAAPAAAPTAPVPPPTPALAKPPGVGAQLPPPDVEALAHNIAQAIQQGGRVLAAYLRPRESGEIKTTVADEIGEMVRSIGRVAEYYMAEPQRAFTAQAALTSQFVDLWAATLQRLQGEKAEPIAPPDASDKRFADAAWRDNPYFDFIKQAYVLTTRWADDLVKHADELEPHDRDKAQFYLRQVTAALSPSNFIATNPELIRTTLAESGENLVRGLTMLAEDIQAGHGTLRIRQADARAFKLGVNLATTPGKVIFRNELIELIQYEPTTPEVYKRPLLIVPPWINKFYILDLNPEKSFVRWAVAQGVTVFVVSWVNPDERHAGKDFDSYMREGILTALDCVEKATGGREAAAIGYCVGGTLLAATLAYMAAVGDKRITSATFFAAQIDFTDPGELKVFVDAEQLKAVEARMAEQGYLEGSEMANAFNMLRPNDLIWSYYVNNYLKGKEPMPFDLLVWNSDSTRMPAANHNFYLRHCYLQNDLSNGRMILGGKTLDLKKVTIPVYELATKEDHIAPARSVFTGAKSFGGPVRYVMAGSGHIAGVVNPPEKPKYQYWSGGPPKGEFDAWVAAARETPGSWWPDWLAWLTAQAPEKVAARKPGGGKLKPLADAPGDYVRVKS